MNVIGGVYMNMEVYTSNVENNELILEGNFKTLSISFSDEETLRIRHFNKLETQFSYLNQDVDFEIEFGVVRRTRNEITMISKKLCVEIDLDPFNIKVFRINGGLLFSGEELDFIDINNKKTNIKFNLDLDTILYGVFKDEKGKFKYFPKVRYLIPKHKWKKGLYELVNSNFLFTSKEFGIFANTYKQVNYKFNWQSDDDSIDQYLADGDDDKLSVKERNSTQSISQILIDDDYFDIFLLFKKNNNDFLKEYNSLIGKPPLLPKWSYGYIHAKENSFGVDEIKSSLSEFREKNIPIDSVVLDGIDNNLLLDDFFLKENKISLLISIYPFLKYIEREKSKELIWNELRKINTKNVGGYKLDTKDYTEKERTNSILLLKFIWEKLGKNKRSLFILENINPGLSRYGIIISKSKYTISYENLRNNIKYLIASNILGQPYFANSINLESDGKKIDDDVDPELFIRWLQSSVFFPIFLFSNSMFFAEPWVYGKSVEKIVTEFIKLRYSLMPYIYSNMRRTFDTSKPFIEPVSDGFESEYYFGSNIIVAPIVERGSVSKKVFIPEGIWWDYWTKSSYEGPEEIEIRTRLDRIPLFIRAGSIIPTSTGIQNADEKTNRIYFHIFPNGSGSFTFYDDDGESNDYLEDFMTVDISYTENKDKRIILINPAIGNYDGMDDIKNVNIVIHNISKIIDLKIDGESCYDYKYDEREFVIINMKDYQLRKGCTISYYDKNEFKILKTNEMSCSIDFFQSSNGINLLKIVALNYPKDTKYNVNIDLPDGYSLNSKLEPLSSKITEDLNLNLEIIDSKLGERAKDCFKVSVEIGDNTFCESFELVCESLTKWSKIDCVHGDENEVETVCESIEISNNEIYVLSGDEKKFWIKAEGKDSNFGIMQFSMIKKYDNAISYAKTRVYSFYDREIFFQVSCSDNICLFLNGEKQFEIDDILYKNTIDKPVKLFKGWNRVLVKVKSRFKCDPDDFIGFRISILDDKKAEIKGIYYDY